MFSTFFFCFFKRFIGVWCIQFDSLRIVSASHDHSIKIWDLESGTMMHTLKGHLAPVNFLQFNDSKIVTGAEDGCIKIWDFSV